MEQWRERYYGGKRPEERRAALRQWPQIVRALEQVQGKSWEQLIEDRTAWRLD
jgi:hypothetical protein